MVEPSTPCCCRKRISHENSRSLISLLGGLCTRLTLGSGSVGRRTQRHKRMWLEWTEEIIKECQRKRGWDKQPEGKINTRFEASVLTG